MSDVKWIKISTGIFDDEKIKLIEAMPDSDTILVIWIKLLTLAGRVNSRGEIFVSDSLPYTETTLAHVFQRKLNTVKMALKTFENFGMIEILENQKIVITNWSKHQSVDGLEKIRESSRERVKRFRDKEKLLALVDKEENKEENREDTDKEKNVTCNATVTLPFNSSKFELAWKDWESHRRGIRKPNSELSRRAQLKKLAVMGEARAVDAINNSIAGGYTGIFEEKSASSKRAVIIPERDDRPDDVFGTLRAMAPKEE